MKVRAVARACVAIGSVIGPVVATGWAQAEWRSVLYPETWTPPSAQSFESERLVQDFSYAGYHRGDAEIPSIAGPVVDVTTLGADPTGVVDATAAIQSAIDDLTTRGGGVVYVPAGTFLISPQATNAYALRLAGSGVVLRGAGRERTFLLNTATQMQGKHIIRVEGSSSSWSTVPSGSPQPRITADLATPTTTIPVTSTSGLAVGDWVVLRADATNAFVAEHGMTDLWGDLGASLGGVMFHRRIVAIDSGLSTLTIDVPIRYYLKTRDDARVHRAVPHIEEVGLEHFSIGNREHPLASSSSGWGEEDYGTAGTGAFDAHGSYAIALRRVRNAWISGVASFRPAGNTVNTHLLSNGILLQNCRGVTVRDCDFQRPLYGGGGGNGYMYRLQSSNECLLRDCAARYNRHGFVFSHMACSGNVILGGIAQVTRVQAAGAGTTSGEGCDHHMHLSQSNLIDNVELDRDFFTAHYRGTSGTPPQHGHGGTHSVYWNLVGRAYQSGKQFIVRSEQARYGYIIGTRGPASGITTPGTGTSRTAPVDHVEGAGQGHLLRPLSLYHDQRTRRLAREPAGPPTARVVNLSARTLVGGSAGSPIAGFAIGGVGDKRILVRAVGPGLAVFGVPGVAVDPRLTLVAAGGGVLGVNDAWLSEDAPTFAATGAFALAPGSRDAAIVATLAAGPYTTPVGATGAGGVVLLELFDAETGQIAAGLMNASTRAHVGTGAGLLIAGFVVNGSGLVRLLVRAVGPGLAAYGVSDLLSDPGLTLYADNLAVAVNDDWGASIDPAGLVATGRSVGAFDLPAGSRDAAMVITLPAGSYTAHVAGAGGATGTALMEIYVVP